MEKKEWRKNIYAHMMVDYYVNILREIRTEREMKLKSIKTKKEADIPEILKRIEVELIEPWGSDMKGEK